MKKDKLSLKTNILKEIFNIAPRKYRVSESDNLVLAKKFRVSKEELNNSLEFLFEIHFIKKTTGPNYKEDRMFEWEITEDGLHYLEKSESKKKQEEFNKILALTACVLALAGIYSFLEKVAGDNEAVLIIGLIIFFAVLICIFPIIKFVFKKALE